MKNAEQPENLLVVDDDAPHLRTLCDTLGAQGYSVTGFTSALEALESLRARRDFALLLTDFMMPEMDGIALLNAAQEIDPRLVAVVMTGHGTISTAVSAMKEGALDYIQKPFKLSALIPVLARALDVRRLRLANEALERSLRARTLELEAANRELESFSFSVSHDLRAPLRTIDGFTVVLVESLGPDVPAEALGHAAKVRGSVTRMNALIDDLLRLARTSQAELRRVQVNLSALAREIAAQLRESAPKRWVEWVVEPDLFIDADEGLMRVVLENLLSNAWKYSGKTEKARIEFGLEAQPEGGTAFFVRDNGAGFEMRAAERLFSPFRRLHSEQEFPGTGVGLATVQRIIRRHGGRIWAEAARNKGAVFRFTIPPA